jgi:hypothetical protein
MSVAASTQSLLGAHAGRPVVARRRPSREHRGQSARNVSDSGRCLRREPTAPPGSPFPVVLAAVSDSGQ